MQWAFRGAKSHGDGDQHNDHQRDPVGNQRRQNMCPQHGRSWDRHGLESLENAVLHIGEQPNGGVRNAGRDRDQHDSGQQIIDVVVGARLDGAAEHVDEQQHHGDRRDRDSDNGVWAAGDVAHGAAQQDGCA